jgi:hypothetical protein
MKNQVHFIKFVVFFIIFVVLVYSRSVNIGWGLPFPMHPDERNMAVAVEQLSCESLSSCFNPNFFAYGQLPIYLAFLLIKIFHIFSLGFDTEVSFLQATIALRVISVIASIFTILVSVDIANKLLKRLKMKWSKFQQSLVTIALLIFSPGLIQFAHFGTTESLLMLFYTLLSYVGILLIEKKIDITTFTYQSAIITGLSLATKLSGVSFLAIPIFLFVYYYFFQHRKIKKLYSFVAFFSSFVMFIIVVFFVAFVLSPYSFLSFNDFLGSMKYESDVALGRYVAFYTRQFEDTVPVFFQFVYSLPFVFGFTMFISSVLGFLFLSWRIWTVNFLRLAILVYAVPQLFLFAKWTRFLAPVFTLFLLLGVLFLFLMFFKVKNYLFKKSKNYLGYICSAVFYIIIFLAILPGVAYLKIYQAQDVRFVASKWIYENLPEESYILSETANVIDIPVPPPVLKSQPDFVKNYQYRSFDFYNLDFNPLLVKELKEELEKADYIIVPSRRVFANHSCLRPNGFERSFLHRLVRTVFANYYNYICEEKSRDYPILNSYYKDLFSGELGFKKVAEFKSFPRIELFDKTLLEFPDEDAEETWTVFDHPVIRIYKKDVL